MKINKKLLPIKGHYFFKNAGAAPILPFIPVIAKELGFSGTTVGVVLTVVPVLSLLTKPVAGAIADKFSAHKSLCNDTSDVIVVNDKGSDHCFIKRLRTLMDSTPLHSQMLCNDTGEIVDAVNGHKLYWDDRELNSHMDIGISFPLVKEGNQIYLKLDYISINSRTWNEPWCSTPTEWNCTLDSQNSMIHDVISRPLLEGYDIYKSWQFWAFAIVVILGKVCEENVTTMGDTISLKVLGERTNDIGLQMLWGAAGWGLVSVGTGYLVDIMSMDQPVKDFSYAYYISSALYGMTFIVSIFFDLKEDKLKEKSKHIFQDVRKEVLRRPQFLIFLACVVVCGACSALVWNYLFWFIEDISSEDGCSDSTWVKTLDGLTLCVHCFVGEIPFFFISGWMLKTFGHAHCMSIVLLGFGVRFTLYYFLTSAWWILPIESLNGITFATLVSTMMTYANAVAPPGTDGTMQGLVSAFFEGVGVCIGSLLGGIFIDTWGIRQLFLIAGLISTCLAVLHSSIHIRWSSKYNERKLPQNSLKSTQITYWKAV